MPNKEETTKAKTEKGKGKAKAPIPQSRNLRPTVQDNVHAKSRSLLLLILHPQSRNMNSLGNGTEVIGAGINQAGVNINY